MRLELKIEDKLNKVSNSIVNALLPAIDKIHPESAEETFEDIIYEIAWDGTIEYLLSDRGNEVANITKLLAEKVFISMSQGTEFEKYPGFLHRLKSILEIGEFYFDIKINRNGEVFISLYDDTLGSISDWGIAILSARSQLRKSPNPKYINNRGYQKILPKLRSLYWKNVVYPTDNFDFTEELRLSLLPEDSAAFVFALESGTGGALGDIVSEGGFPTPRYSSKGNFLELLRVSLEEAIYSLVKKVIGEITSKLENRLSNILSRHNIRLTDTLSKAFSKLSKEEVLSLVNKAQDANTNEALGVIINIEGKYYEIIKTSSGKLGVRYSLKANKRKRI